MDRGQRAAEAAGRPRPRARVSRSRTARRHRCAPAGVRVRTSARRRRAPWSAGPRGPGDAHRAAPPREPCQGSHRTGPNTPKRNSDRSSHEAPEQKRPRDPTTSPSRPGNLEHAPGDPFQLATQAQAMQAAATRARLHCLRDTKRTLTKPRTQHLDNREFDLFGHEPNAAHHPNTCGDYVPRRNRRSTAQTLSCVCASEVSSSTRRTPPEKTSGSRNARISFSCAR